MTSVDPFNDINLPKFGNAVGIAIISQFLADIVITLIDDNIIETDVILSDISVYYGAVAAGIVLYLLPDTMDRLELIIFSAVTFQYVNNLVANDLDEDFEINESDLIFSIILTEILTTVFDKKALYDYYNKYSHRHHLSMIDYDTDRTSFEFLFFLFLSNLISYNFKGEDNTGNTK